MIIASIAISVLSITISAYSMFQARKASQARKERERLAAMPPVIHVDGILGKEAEDQLRNAIRRELRIRGM